MIKFLCDAQLPPLLCKKLNEAGYEATHVTDIGLLYAKDSEIWRYALSHTMVIMTKDSDFAQRSHLVSFAPKICSSIEQGERLIEIRQLDIVNTI